MTCTQAMVGLLNQIISDSIQIVGQDLPCVFEAVAIGSLARGDATPYSDAEFMFLIERSSPENVVFFEKLAVVSYFLINNIGETKLSHLAIQELHGWFKDRCGNGFQIDGLGSNAGNIPTGNGEGSSNFIVTPSDLATKYGHIYSNPVDEQALRGDLTAMLAYTKSIGCYGSDQDKGLLAEFQQLIRAYKNCERRDDINFRMLLSDLRKFNFKPSEELRKKLGYTVDVKEHLFRFPSLLVMNLSIIHQSHDQSVWETMRSLYTKGKISQSLQQSLLIQNACACFTRLSAYLHHNSHDDRISVAQGIESVNPENANKSLRRWFAPLDLVMLLFIYIKSLKDQLYKAENILDLIAVLNDNSQTSISWLTHMEALYQCGRFADAYAKLAENFDLRLLENRPTDLIESLLKTEANPSDAIHCVGDVLLANGEELWAQGVYGRTSKVWQEKSIYNDFAYWRFGGVRRLHDIQEIPYNCNDSLGEFLYKYFINSYLKYNILIDSESSADTRQLLFTELVKLVSLTLQSYMKASDFDENSTLPHGLLNVSTGQVNLDLLESLLMQDFIPDSIVENVGSLEGSLNLASGVLDDACTNITTLPAINMVSCLGDICRTHADSFRENTYESNTLTTFAETCYRNASDLTIKISGKFTLLPELGYLYEMLGRLTFQQGRYPEAMVHLELSQSVYDELSLNSMHDAADIMEVFEMLARCYKASNDSQRYIKYLSEAIEVHKKEGNFDRAINILQKVVLEHLRFGFIKDAKEATQTALQYVNHMDDCESKCPAYIQYMLGILHQESGEWDEAIRCFERAISENMKLRGMSEIQDGRNFPHLSDPKNQYSASQDQEKYFSILDTYSTVMGDWFAKASLAGIYTSLGFIDLASAHYEQASKILHRALSSMRLVGHNTTAICTQLASTASGMAQVKLAISRDDQSVKCILSAQDLCEEMLSGESHISTLRIIKCRAQLLTDQSIESEADAMYQQASIIIESLYGINVQHIIQAEIHETLGAYYSGIQCIPKSQACYEKALGLYQSLHSESASLNEASVLHNLGKVTGTVNRCLSSKYYHMSLAKYDKICCSTDSELTKIRAKVGRSNNLRNLGQIEKSVAMCQESLIAFLDQSQSGYYSPIVTDIVHAYRMCLESIAAKSTTQQKYSDTQNNELCLIIIIHDYWVAKNGDDRQISIIDHHLLEIMRFIKKGATDEMFFDVFKSIANSCLNEYSAPRQALRFIDVMLDKVLVNDQRAYSLYLKGRAHHKLKQYEPAIESFGQSLSSYTMLDWKQTMSKLHLLIARSYSDNEMYAEAEASAYKCIQLEYSIHGEGVSNKDLLSAMLHYGNASGRMKKYKQGEAALLTSRAMCEDLIGWSTSSFEKYIIMTCTGRLYLDMGEDYADNSLLNKAKEACEVALATVHDLYGSECSQQTCVILNDLGLIHISLGDCKQGKKFLMDALNLMKCDDDDDGMLYILLNIGRACMRLGELDDAERYLNEAQTKFKEFYPDQSCHDLLAHIVNVTGQLKMKRHHVSGAISDYKKSLAMFHSIYTRDKLDEGFETNLHGLAIAYDAQHEQELKYQCCLKRLAYYLRIVGVDFSHAVIQSILDSDMTIAMSQYYCSPASDPILKMTIALHEIWKRDIIYLTGESFENCDKSLLVLLDGSSISKPTTGGPLRTSWCDCAPDWRVTEKDSDSNSVKIIAYQNKCQHGWLFRPYTSSNNGTEAMSLLQNIGRDCRSMGSPKRATAYFTKVLSLHEELHGAQCCGEFIADVVEWLSELYQDAGESQKSPIVYERWLTRYMGEQPILPTNPLGKRIVNMLVQLGNVYAKLNMWDKCLTCFHRSLEVTLTYHDNQATHYEVLITLERIKEIYCLWLEQDQIVALAKNKNIIKTFIKTEDQNTRLAIGYLQLAGMRSENEKYDIAQGLNGHALTWWNEIPMQMVDNLLHIEILNGLGTTHLKTKNPSGAILLLKQSLSIYHGHSSRAKGLSSAVSYLKSQWAILRNACITGPANIECLASTCSSLADAYMIIEKFKLAQEYYMESLKLYSSINTDGYLNTLIIDVQQRVEKAKAQQYLKFSRSTKTVLVKSVLPLAAVFLFVVMVVYFLSDWFEEPIPTMACKLKHCIVLPP